MVRVIIVLSKWGNEIYISKIAYVACCLNDVDRMQKSVIHSNKAQ